MDADRVQIDPSWKEALRAEFSQPYFAEIKQNLLDAKSRGKIIYPVGKLIFNAFNSTPFDKVKVVILGQDPYHGPGEAMGLCFSVPKSIRIPPSLQNIFKELHRDLGTPIPSHGDLTAWGRRGVFLLNAILTVEHKQPGSHKSFGWQLFTDAVIRILSEKREGLVFLLWGRFAQTKREFIDELRHYVLTSSHPSPLAGGGFYGNCHFSKTNDILQQQNIAPIDWSIS